MLYATRELEAALNTREALKNNHFTKLPVRASCQSSAPSFCTYKTNYLTNIRIYRIIGVLHAQTTIQKNYRSDDNHIKII